MVWFIILGWFSQAFSLPDSHDSVIVESKTVTPSNGPAAVLVRVEITNKDTLASITLVLEEKSVSGGAYATLANPPNPRTEAGVFIVCPLILQQLPLFPTTNFNNYHSNPPDTFLWSRFYDFTNPTISGVPPNMVRACLLDIKFDTVLACPGQFELDAGRIGTLTTLFTTKEPQDLEVNFLKGTINVVGTGLSPPVFTNCAGASQNVLYGRPFSYDFNSDREGQAGVTYTVQSGPGSVNPTTGQYSFSGQCALGSVPVTVRVSQCGSFSDCQFTLTITDNAPSCAATQPTVTVSHGQTAANHINTFDPDAGDVVTITQQSGPGSTTAQGDWSYTTSCNDVGLSSQTIQEQVRDGFGSCQPGPGMGNCSFQLVVTNAPPSITCPGDSTVIGDGGCGHSAVVCAMDADPADIGNLTISLVSGPTGLTLQDDGDCGRIRWTPTPADTGVHTVIVRAVDLCGAEGRCQYNITVIPRSQCIPGDLNGDGVLAPADVVLILNCIIVEQIPPCGEAACDVNCSCIADVEDIDRELLAVFLGEPLCQ